MKRNCSQPKLVAGLAAGVSIGISMIGTMAMAGGLARPNGWGPQNTSVGGAGSTMVDDPTALYINPAALAFSAPQVMLGAEYVFAPRTYTPINAAGTRGEDQSVTAKAPVPLFGAIGRFSYNGRPSRFTIGMAVMNTFGGKLRYPKKPDVPAINATQDAVVEFLIGTSFEISDRLAIGASLRVGLGLFSSDVTDSPVTAKVEANGLGVGMTLGGMFRPTDRIKLAAVWRSPMTVRTSGESVIQFPLGPSAQLAEHTQRWPQQAILGASVDLTRAFTLAFQADWSEWSRIQVISVELPKMPALSQRYAVAWTDNYAARLGTEYRINTKLRIRGGAWFDSNAVPNRTIERQYRDGDKLGISCGAGLRLGKWAVDFAADYGLPNKRTVADNRAANVGWPDMQNRAPGEHGGSIYTGELTFRRLF